MKITWLGHSAFRLEESTGTTVVTDPYAESLVGYRMQRVNADAVTLSHHHRDHDEVSQVAGSPQVFDTVGAWEVKGVDITSMHSWHDPEQGSKRGPNLIFKYRMEGMRRRDGRSDRHGQRAYDSGRRQLYDRCGSGKRVCGFSDARHSDSDAFQNAVLRGRHRQAR